ncbi:hypothetical protein [Pyrinomonas sp.]|uniref:hypothetical protein n=1 Tax=Pyrinomonas sp. TaxID=2080306 RepID=UPI003332A424
MIHFESRVSEHAVDGATRLLLLDRLQEMGFVPLIRSARARCFEVVLSGPTRVREMERAVAAWMEAERAEPYVRGDLFFLRDAVLFLIFGSAGGESETKAGVVYTNASTEQLVALDDFCQKIEESLDAMRRASGTPLIEARGWRRIEPRFGRGWERFIERAEASQARLSEVPLQATDLLTDEETRRLLRRMREGQAEGVAAAPLGDHVDETLLSRLTEAGLLRREVAVVCRREGRALFRLPSPEALELILTSNAVCSECGAAVADERVEERVALTDQATKLLDGGAWLAARTRLLLRELGIRDEQMAIMLTPEGDALAMVGVHAELFLLHLRDGDFALAHARRALDLAIEHEATHLIVVSTGKIGGEARSKLRDYARRQAAGEVLLVEGMESAPAELRHAFDRAAQRALVAELSELDSSLGLSVGHLIWTRFRMTQRIGTLRDATESALGAVAGKLRDL